MKSSFLLPSLLLTFLPLILNLTLPSPNTNLQKRTTSLIGSALFEGPESYKFSSSTCSRSTNLTSYIITSTTTPEISQILHSPPQIFENGSCQSPRLCLDGIFPPPLLNNNLQGSVGSVAMALCADATQTFEIRGSLRRRDLAEKGIPIPYAEPTLYKAVQAVFSDVAGLCHVVGAQAASTIPGVLGEGTVETGLNGGGVGGGMDWIKVAAQGHECTPQSCTWITLREESCAQCSALGLQPVPEGTTRMLVSAMVPVDVPNTEENGAVLWWNSL